MKNDESKWLVNELKCYPDIVTSLGEDTETIWKQYFVTYFFNLWLEIPDLISVLGESF